VAVIDQEGVIVAVNDAWRRFARDHKANPEESVLVGVNYLKVCRRAARAAEKSAEEALIGIEAVLHRLTTAFALEYHCSGLSDDGGAGCVAGA
jgi:hypothetical protein